MSSKRQAWLIAFGTSDSRLPDEWVADDPSRLRKWRISGGNYLSGFKDGDHLLYYAAGHKVLLGAGRTSGPPDDLDNDMRIQTFVAVPFLGFAPAWDILGIDPKSIEGKRAIKITADQYDRGLKALISEADRRFRT